MQRQTASPKRWYTAVGLAAVMVAQVAGIVTATSAYALVVCNVTAGVDITGATVTGTAGDDTINCSASDEPLTIEGGDGNDTITGGGAADEIRDETDGDDDTINGGPGLDQITANGVALVINGDADGADVVAAGLMITVNSGGGDVSASGLDIDIVSGGGDVEAFGLNINVMSAGGDVAANGQNLVTVDSGGGDVLAGGQFITVNSAPGGDVSASGLDINVTSGGGDVEANGLTITVDSGGGDVFAGGTVSVIVFSHGGSVLAGGLNIVVDSGDGDVEASGLTITITGNGDVTASGQDVTLMMGAATNKIVVSALGVATIDSGDGHDDIQVDAAESTINSAAGNDTIATNGGNTTIVGGGGLDRIRTGSGDDVVHGGPDNDVLEGGDGADQLFGDSGDDRLDGIFGEDVEAADTLDGGPGADVCNPSASDIEVSCEATSVFSTVPDLPPVPTLEGTGPLTSISGELFDSNDVDLYRICVTGDDFSAATVGGAAFDTQLFLFGDHMGDGFFSEGGPGVVANDDDLASGAAQSSISGPTYTNGDPLTFTPGLHLLAVASGGNEPLDRPGDPIFPGTPTDVEAPLPDAGGLARWSGGGGESGTYTIHLTGATFFGEPPCLETDLEVTKEGAHEVIVGETLTYTLTVTNHGPHTASDVVLTDFLPDGATLVSAVPSQGTCDATLRCELGSLADDATATVTIVIRAGEVVFITNRAEVTGAEPDPNPDNNIAFHEASVLPVPPVDEAPDLPPGRTLDGDGPLTSITGEIGETNDVDLYRICVTGDDFFATTAGGTTFDTQLFLFSDVGLGVAANDNELFTEQSTIAGPTYTNGDPLIFTPGAYLLGVSSFNNDPLDGQGNPIFPGEQFDIEGPFLDAGPLAAWTGEGFSEGPYTIALTGATFIGEAPCLEADVEVTKSDDEPVAVGETLTYTVTVTNHGPSDATDVVVVDTLPAGVTLLSVTPSQGTCQGTTCLLGTLADDATATVSIAVRADVAGTITNTATVAAIEPDPVPENNTATETTVVAPVPSGADLEVTKTDDEPVTVGETLTYTVTVTNHGPSDATDVVVVDTLPDRVTLLSATPSQGSCQGTACLLGTLADGATATVSIAVRADVAGTITNTATVAATEPDPVAGNNTATETTVVQATPPVGTGSLTVSVVRGDPDFSLDGPFDADFTLDPGESRTFEDIPAGVYTLTMTGLEDGLVVDAISCGAATLSVDLAARQVTFEIGDEDTVTCRFTVSDVDDDGGGYDDDPGGPGFVFDSPFDDAGDPGQPGPTVQPTVVGDVVVSGTGGAGGRGPEVAAVQGDGDVEPAVAPATGGELPRTGFDLLPMGVGAGLVFAGQSLRVVGRRRRTRTA